MRRSIRFGFAAGLCSLWSAAFAQSPSLFGMTVAGKLTVGLLDRSPQVLEPSDIARLPHTTVKVKNAGKTSTYTGVPLKELLVRAGAVFSAERHEAGLGSVVVVLSVDGPSVLFAMAELDSTLTNKRVLFADGKDGKPLAAPEGPFRIIVPDEKEPIRWAKQVWAIYIAQVLEPHNRP